MVPKKTDQNEQVKPPEGRQVLPSEANDIAKRAMASSSFILEALRQKRADVHMAMKALEVKRKDLEWQSADLSAQIDWWQRHWEAEGQLMQALGVEAVQDFLYAAISDKHETKE